MSTESSVRFEHKYFINAAQYTVIQQILASLAGKQRKIVNTSSNSISPAYPVVSLYYDTDDFSYYLQKIEGEHRHIKVRARKYCNDFFDNSDFFLEVKIKIGDRLAKARQKIAGGKKLLAPSEWHKLDFSDLNRENNLYLLKPKCFVEYEREVYEFFVENRRFRVTFDKNILAWPHREFKSLTGVSQKAFSKFEVLPYSQSNRILMEVKHSIPEYPTFFQNTLGQFSIKRVYFSKYAASIDRIGRF